MRRLSGPAAPNVGRKADRHSLSLLGIVASAVLLVLLVMALLAVHRLGRIPVGQFAAQSEAGLRDTGVLQNILRQSSVAHQAERSYLLSGDPGFLATYTEALDQLAELTQSLPEEALLPGRGDAVADLRATQRRDLEQLQREVDFHKAEAHAMAMAGIASGLDDRLAREAVTAVLTVQQQVQQKLRTAQNAALLQQERLVQLGEALAGAVLVLALALGAFCLLRLGRQQRMDARLAAVQAAAATSDRAKSRFLASASHDLRQPLHALNLFLSALERRVVDSDSKRLMHGLRQAINSMDRMFNGLLDISKLDARAITADMIDLPVAEILEALRVEYVAVAADRGLHFSLRTSAAMVHTDPALLESILRNLLSNAVKYTQEGAISVSCRQVQTHVFIDITDTGPGIPEDKIDTIFEEFQRLEGSAPAQGLGLGLAIVRRLAELLGIQVQLRSILGRGSTFTLVIPAARTAVALAEAPRMPVPIAAAPMAEPPLRRLAAAPIMPPMPVLPPSPPPRPAARGGAAPRILLLEKDPVLRASLAGEFLDWGLRITATASADEPPDLVIFDTNPGRYLAGLDALARELADLMTDWAPPVLILTDTSDPDILQDLAEAGYFYLIKPVLPSDMRKTVLRLLQQRPDSGADENAAE